MRSVPSRLLFAALLAGLVACSGEPPPPPAPPPPLPAAEPPPPPAPSPQAGDTWNYECGDLAITAADAGVSVTLTWSDHELVLPAAEAANGNRYADEMGNEFWSKGDEAMLTLVGDPAPRNCVRAGADPAAGADGPASGFHASGKDRDWVADVGLLDAPTLRVQADGATIDVQELVAGDDRWSGHSAAGREVSLQFERTPCDAGSGEQFEARATLRLGDEERSGCGRFVH